MRHSLHRGALVAALCLPLMAVADDSAPQLAIDCDAWINLGESFAAEVPAGDFAQWLIARDQRCEGTEVWTFSDAAEAEANACVVKDIDPVGAVSLDNILCADPV